MCVFPLDVFDIVIFGSSFILYITMYISVNELGTIRKFEYGMFVLSAAV